MAVRANKSSKSRRILCAATLHPNYLSAARNIVKNQGIELVTWIGRRRAGTIDPPRCEAHVGEDYAALVIGMPNFFGCIEAVDELTDWAHKQGALFIGVVNPTALGLLRPPGEWGERKVRTSLWARASPLVFPFPRAGPMRDSCVAGRDSYGKCQAES